MDSRKKKAIDELYSDISDYPFLIAQDVGFTDVRKFPHNRWMRNILFGTSDYTLMAHRGSYKSSILSVCIALFMVFFPDKNIIFLRKADNDVAEMIRMVKKALESDIFRRMAFIIYQRPIQFVKSSESELTTNLYKSASGSSQLLGIGLKSSITGKHADIVITDDICNISDRISKAERERTKLQYQELENIKNRGGRIINTGTKWHKDDFFSLIDDDQIDIYDYKKTGLISEEQVTALKEKMSPSLFACNYELKIIASEDVIFENPVLHGDVSKIYQAKFCHIDAAYGGEDYTAFTICRKAEGKYYIYGRLWQKAVDDCIAGIREDREKFNAGVILCERNGDKGYLKKELQRQGERCSDYWEDMNKYIKIVTYLKGVWKDVVFIEGTDQEYIDQILDYNEFAEHDDAPDSCASAIRKLWKMRDETAEEQVSAFGY